jgi:hypothetical protein
LSAHKSLKPLGALAGDATDDTQVGSGSVRKEGINRMDRMNRIKKKL